MTWPTSFSAFVLMCSCRLLLLFSSSSPLLVSGSVSSTFQLAAKCNSTDSLLISSQSSIYLKNYESQWTTSNETTSSQQAPCRISFTSSPSLNVSSTAGNVSTSSTSSFLLRFDLIKAICNLNQSKITMEINTKDSFSLIDDICGRFSSVNYYTFKAASNYFEITFKDLSASGLKTADYHLFQAISSITISQFKNSSESGCGADEFQCSQPPDICLSKTLKCDAIVSCPDESDETGCVEEMRSQASPPVAADPSISTDSSTSTTTLSTTSTTTVTLTADISNSTTQTNDSYLITKANKPANDRRYDIFIGLLGLFLFGALILVGIWLYGRRKRQWRDFLARLDNNTDWEYEQLEDGPAISRTNVIFNMNDDAFDPNMAPSYNSLNTGQTNSNNRSGPTKVNERTPVRP